MAKYEWRDEEEKDRAQCKLQTEWIVSDVENFKKLLSGDLVVDSDTRYLVWMAPARFMFDPKGEEGVQGPLEAIQAALDLHLDGGWDWLVWDVRQQVGFTVDSNTYIYEPLEAWMEQRISLDDMESASLRDLMSEVREILQKRGEL